MFNTTIPNQEQPRAANRTGRVARRVATATLAVAISFAAGCGAPQERVASAQAPAAPELDSAWQGRIDRTVQAGVRFAVAPTEAWYRYLDDQAAAESRQEDELRRSDYFASVINRR